MDSIQPSVNNTSSILEYSDEITQKEKKEQHKQRHQSEVLEEVQVGTLKY